MFRNRKAGEAMSDKFQIPNTIFLQCHDDDGELLDPHDDDVPWSMDDIDGHNTRYMRVKPCPERCGYETDDLPDPLKPTRPCSTCDCKGWVIK